MNPQELKNQKELLELKYRLKTELEELIHKHIMEEINTGSKIDLKARETRRGQK